jgi:hypothetical protein
MLHHLFCLPPSLLSSQAARRGARRTSLADDGAEDLSVPSSPLPAEMLLSLHNLPRGMPLRYIKRQAAARSAGWWRRLGPRAGGGGLWRQRTEGRAATAAGGTLGGVAPGRWAEVVETVASAGGDRGGSIGRTKAAASTGGNGGRGASPPIE